MVIVFFVMHSVYRHSISEFLCCKNFVFVGRCGFSASSPACMQSLLDFLSSIRFLYMPYVQNIVIMVVISTFFIYLQWQCFIFFILSQPTNSKMRISMLWIGCQFVYLLRFFSTIEESESSTTVCNWCCLVRHSKTYILMYAATVGIAIEINNCSL